MQVITWPEQIAGAWVFWADQTQQTRPAQGAGQHQSANQAHHVRHGWHRDRPSATSQDAGARRSHCFGVYGRSRVWSRHRGSERTVRAAATDRRSCQSSCKQAGLRPNAGGAVGDARSRGCVALKRAFVSPAIGHVVSSTWVGCRTVQDCQRLAKVGGPAPANDPQLSISTQKRGHRFWGCVWAGSTPLCVDTHGHRHRNTCDCKKVCLRTPKG